MQACRLRRLCAAAIGTMLAASGPSGAQPIRDDFTEPQLAARNWFVCHRDENEFTLVDVPDRGFSAAKVLVRDREGAALAGASGAHTACADERGAYRRDGAQRAELWEEDALHQPFGTEVWYQFAMYIDPSVSPRHGHLVIGQWKQRGGNSPFVAQRFRGRAFTITIEQDDRSPGREPAKTQCRVLVASDRDEPPPSLPVAAAAGILPSAAHGEADAVRALGPASRPQARTSEVDPMAAPVPRAGRLPGCATDLTVERFGTLPVPFGRWTTMRYHIKATAAGDGLLEVWADGRPIVKVTGRIGFAADRETADQYFKFGPYRQSAEGSIYALLARFRRGASLEEIERD